MDFYVDDGYVDEVVGMDMIDDGLMNIEEGLILTQMGMPGLGAMEMAIGAMEIAEGENLVELGMMENNMGYGYGYGLQTAVDLAVDLAVMDYVCMGIGCTYPCCRTQVIVVQQPYMQQPVYANQVNRPQQYPQQVNRPQQYPQQQQQQQVVYKQQPQMVQQQQRVVIQQQVQPQVVIQQQVQQVMGAQGQSQVIYQGSLFRREFLLWQSCPGASLTTSHFLNQPLSHMTKIKIKNVIAHQNYLFMKTTLNLTNDHYFAVPKQEQINWFCAVVWARLGLGRYGCNLNAHFTGIIQAKIMRKSQFIGEWAFRDVLIDNQGLRSFVSRQLPPTTRLFRIQQLWTRFQLLEQGQILVIKLMHDGTKYQYGVPIQNAVQWIKAFYSLMLH